MDDAEAIRMLIAAYGERFATGDRGVRSSGTDP